MKRKLRFNQLRSAVTPSGSSYPVTLVKKQDKPKQTKTKILITDDHFYAKRPSSLESASDLFNGEARLPVLEDSL